jgi:hypothetical protein
MFYGCTCYMASIKYRTTQTGTRPIIKSEILNICLWDYALKHKKIELFMTYFYMLNSSH